MHEDYLQKNPSDKSIFVNFLISFLYSENAPIWKIPRFQDIILLQSISII